MNARSVGTGGGPHMERRGANPRRPMPLRRG